jgi:transposase
MTFIAALRCDRVDAPCLFDGPINGEAFTAYVRDFLVPTLSPGDVMIMDNLGSHRGKAVRQAIREAGAKLIFLLPQILARPEPYRTGLLQAEASSPSGSSPLVRRPHGRHRRAPRHLHVAECANYLQNSGYGAV